MIARIAYFDNVTPEQRAARGVYFREQFLPALTAQDGYLAGYFLHQVQGERLQLVSFTVWQSEEHLRLGEQQALAAAPLPGGMAYPDRVETYEVDYRS
jgi:heme-degrading monooxygenase HmoA